MRLAAQGLRNLDSGDESITDELEKAAMRKKARKVHIQALTATALVTVGLLLVG